MSSLHDNENTIIYDNIIIVTDRVVVDRQLQKAVMGMEHASGLIKVMDDRCSSSDLADALNGNTKIIATTIQKFPYIVEEVKNLNNKTICCNYWWSTFNQHLVKIIDVHVTNR